MQALSLRYSILSYLPWIRASRDGESLANSEGEKGVERLILRRMHAKHLQEAFSHPPERDFVEHTSNGSIQKG